jgi:PAS domain S-box-containing protein
VKKDLNGITQSANDAIIVLDKDFRVRFWNKAAVRIFGYSRFEILYEDFTGHSVSPACREEFKNLTGRMLDPTKSNPGNTIQITGLKKNGEEFPVEMSLSYFIDTDKQVNFTLVIRDITQRC